MMANIIKDYSQTVMQEPQTGDQEQFKTFLPLERNGLNDLILGNSIITEIFRNVFGYALPWSGIRITVLSRKTHREFHRLHQKLRI